MKSQLVFGDCMETIRQFSDNSIDICLTDPPYGIDFQSNARKTKLQKIENDEVPFIEWIKPLFSKMKDGGRLLCFYRWDVQDEFLNEITSAGFIVKSQIIWDKVRFGMGDIKGGFSPQHESIIYATKGRYEFKGRRPPSVFRVPRLDCPLHPNEKPVDLIDKLLISVMNSNNDLVFDPFAGSCSTYMSCERLGMKCITTELSEHYYNLGKERIKHINTINDFF